MIETDKRVSELENLGSLEMPSFRDMYGDIPGQIREGIDRYFGSGISENNSTAENSNDIHSIDADVCKSVIEECLEYNLKKKKLDTITLKTISTTPKDKLFNKLNDNGKVESKGLLDITEDKFCTECVWQYCNKYLGPTILTERYTTKGGHFVIHHSGCLRDETIEALEEKLDKNFDRVCKFFKLSEKGKNNYITDVYIFDDLEFYHLSVFGEQKEEWIKGTYDYRALHMFNPDKMEPEKYELLIQASLHEFVHSVSFLNQVLREGWTSEGIAEYLSGNMPDKEQLQDALEKFPLTEGNLDIIFSGDRDVFYSNPKLISRYIYACTAMDYVVKIFGEDKIVEIFRNTDPDKSPFDVLGVTKEEFIEGWSEYVMPPFRSKYGDIPGQIREGIDRYFGSGISENNSTAENSNDIHTVDADVCRSVIEECLEYFLEKKKLATTTLKTISTTPKDKLFNKLNDKGKVEFEGLLGTTEDEFCTGCVWQYCNKYLGPTILTESYTTKGGHFVIHHSDCLRDETIEALEEILDKNFDRVCIFFELTDEEKSNYVTDVYIFEDQEFYNLHAFGIKLNDWGVGSYDYKSLRMLSPDKMQPRPYKSRIQTAFHEFVHSVSYLNQILREGWTSEGIAEYLSGSKPDKKQLRGALKEFPLTKKNLDIIFSGDRDVFYSNPKHKSGYIYACTAVDYIIKKFGKGKIVEIFENTDPNRTPFDVLGVSKKEFMEGWKKYVECGEYIKNLRKDSHLGISQH